MKSRLVSITGATGFLGYHLAAAFIREGWQVRAVVRQGNTKRLPDGVEVVQSPLAAAWLTRAFERTDLIVHTAAVIRAPNEVTFNAVNVEGTRAAIEAANTVGARFLHVSSLAAIGPATPDRPARENDTPHPVNAYGRSKLAAEDIVRGTACTPWTIVRPCAVYGPRDGGFLPLFRLAQRGWFFYVAPPTTCFTFIYIEDLVRALQLAATDDRAVGQTFFVGHPEPKTTDDLLRALAEAFGKSDRLRYVAPVLLDAAAEIGELAWRIGKKPLIDRGRLAELRAPGFVCAVDRLHDVLGFSAPTSLRDGVARTAAWYRERGWV